MQVTVPAKVFLYNSYVKLCRFTRGSGRLDKRILKASTRKYHLGFHQVQTTSEVLSRTSQKRFGMFLREIFLAANEIKLIRKIYTSPSEHWYIKILWNNSLESLYNKLLVAFWFRLSVSFIKRVFNKIIQMFCEYSTKSCITL